MKERTKIALKSVIATVLLGLLTVACGWLTVYFDTSVKSAVAKGFGILVFGRMNVILLIGAIFAPSVIRAATATRHK